MADYQSCFGTSVPVTDVNVNGGTNSTEGDLEVELDEEVAATAAPGLDHIYTYISPNTGWAPVLDQIVTDSAVRQTTEVSISWGGCELNWPDAETASSDYEFQLLAVAGISVFAASGDDGSSDCKGSSDFDGLTTRPLTPTSPRLADKHSTPRSTGSNHEVSWGTPKTAYARRGGAGGGISMDFPMPSWQTGTGVINRYSNPAICGLTARYCREVPDVALDGNWDTGYITKFQGAWNPIGGTSAAAPLLAAMTADANTYSIAHGGGRLGFASPFFYSHPGIFRDITVGTNNTVGGSKYPATAGYDLSTGLASTGRGSFRLRSPPTLPPARRSAIPS